MRLHGYRSIDVPVVGPTLPCLAQEASTPTPAPRTDAAKTEMVPTGPEMKIIFDKPTEPERRLVCP
jgi:hypothetical protein